MVLDYINGHQAEFWIAFGFLLLAIEVLIMGLTTGVILFAGLGALLTGLLMMAGVMPETWKAGIAGFGIFAGVVTALLWQPLRKLQGNHAPRRDTSSDLIGLEFMLEQAITVQQPGKHRYSGIEWRVEIDSDFSMENIAAGQRVVVTSVDAGIFRVKPSGF